MKAQSTKRAKAPSAADIDREAQMYLSLATLIAVDKGTLKKRKESLVKLARKFGIVPPGAEKSLRLIGDTYQATATFGTSSSIDEAVVEQIRIELALLGKPANVFGDLFRQETSHIVAPTAPAAVEKLPKKIRALFAKVMTTKPKEPSLTVEKLKK
jgi:hypothetical protein